MSDNTSPLTVTEMQRLIDRCATIPGLPEEDRIYNHAVELRHKNKPATPLFGKTHTAIVNFDAGKIYYARREG